MDKQYSACKNVKILQAFSEVKCKIKFNIYAFFIYRTLALEYGADLVYTEEIVDQKLLGSQRKVNGSHLKLPSSYKSELKYKQNQNYAYQKISLKNFDPKCRL